RGRPREQRRAGGGGQLGARRDADAAADGAERGGDVAQRGGAVAAGERARHHGERDQRGGGAGPLPGIAGGAMAGGGGGGGEPGEVHVDGAVRGDVERGGGGERRVGRGAERHVG